jgi:hypothetical protein
MYLHKIYKPGFVRLSGDQMETDYYLVSPMMKVLLCLGKRMKGEARKSVSEIFKRDKDSYLISGEDSECWKLEKEGYSVLDYW